MRRAPQGRKRLTVTTSTPPQAPPEPVGPDSVLWEPLRMGSLDLPHRLAMAPMTRDRSAPDGTPNELNATYYRQRASTAVIITEGTQPSADGQGYLLTPGIYTDTHVEGWKKVADAVHAEGGRVIIQLMHVGRISHPDNTPHHRQPVAPSAVTPNTPMFTAGGMQPIPEPRELTASEVGATVEDYRNAAACAIRAGADGVEIHGANGYLVHQFLSSNANRRTDQYGGSVAGRVRFAVEVAEAISGEIGAERTGLQISPGNPFNDVIEDDIPELYGELIAALSPLRLAYLNVAFGDDELRHHLRRKWPTALVNNRAGSAVSDRVADIQSGLADVITLGTRTLANPDIVDRIKNGYTLNEADKETFYSGGAHGYTDYPEATHGPGGGPATV
ncbi:alkene reductase [Streptomyces bauhiniae]|uniref:alkene reductase n=1 Tax=Streptomyces bauhiniae TaxID=2340725 RepID=UPI003669E07E